MTIFSASALSVMPLLNGIGTVSHNDHEVSTLVLYSEMKINCPKSLPRVFHPSFIRHKHTLFGRETTLSFFQSYKMAKIKTNECPESMLSYFTGFRVSCELISYFSTKNNIFSDCPKRGRA